MIEIQKSKQYDLEERTQKFASDCRKLIKLLPRIISNIEDGKQLARSSGSVAANYIEANESFSRKDYYHRVKICRKEAKESKLWLSICDTGNNMELEELRKKLTKEATELTKIFGSIVEKSKSSKNS
jgi:four helix bundle protein